MRRKMDSYEQRTRRELIDLVMRAHKQIAKLKRDLSRQTRAVTYSGFTERILRAKLELADRALVHVLALPELASFKDEQNRLAREILLEHLRARRAKAQAGRAD